MQTLINWKPGAPVDPEHGKKYRLWLHTGEEYVFQYDWFGKYFGTAVSPMIKPHMVAYHSPYEPPTETAPRLTPEEQRYIELGKAVEYAAKKHEPAPIVIVSIEGFMGWYRKDVTK